MPPPLAFRRLWRLGLAPHAFRRLETPLLPKKEGGRRREGCRMPKIGADTVAAPIPTCLRGDPAAQLLGSRSNPLGERAMSGKNRVLKQEAKRREWRVETP